MKQLCLLIGEDNLVIECANILLQRNFEITAIISAIKPIKTWAQKNNILCVSSISEYIKSKNKPVDYLFSVVNSSILKAEHLKIVKKLALNYHDSLLPAYRGLNATTWAILNDEKEHGISWHRIEPEIDAGDIAYQKSFSIDKETVLSLNLRCFEEAVLGFTNIIDAIEAGNLNFYKQSSANKSYYGKDYLLPRLGFINWKIDSGEYIDAYFRALANGHYNNYVGTIKLFYKNTFVIISSLRLGNTDITNARPGEIIKITESGIEIATTSTPVIIEQCTTLSGNKLNALDVVKELSLMEGKQLKALSFDKLNELSIYYKKALLRENFWVKEFGKVIDHNVFSQRTHAKSAKMLNIGSLFLEPSPGSLKKYAISTWFVTIIIIYLYRINNYENSSCFLTNPQDTRLEGIGSKLFGNYFPITCYLDAKNTVGDVLKIVDGTLNDLLKETSYLSDIFLRYPELENISIDSVITISIGSNRKLNSSKSIVHFELDVNIVKVFHNVELNYQDGELRSLLSNITSHLKAIAESVVENAQKCIKDVSLISETELRQIYLWGRGDIRPIPNCTITALIKENVVLRPDSVAVCEEESYVTYHDLWSQSEKIALFIKALRTHVQTPIGIYMPRSKEMIFTVLGILRAGCIYVPLEFKYPLNKINLIINEAEIEHVFCVNSGVERFNTFYGNDKKINTFNVSDILEREVVDETYTDEKNQVSTQSIAYIMFTSGTTGLPKGVLISHQNVINYCLWFQKSASFTNESVIDFSSSLAFDLSIPCTLAPLIAGGTIAVCSEKNKVNAKLYLEHLNINEITHIELTPGYLEILLTYPEKIQTLHYLKYLFLGADVIHTEDVKQWLELCYGCQVVNEYGPTEATVSVTSYFVKNIDSLTGNVVPIGRPGYNSTCYVVDKCMNICPVGMIGELCIGGKQVSRGYLKRPQLTEEKFIEVSFDGNDTLYKTGDLACWLPMGELQFFGRNDHQVKIHGYRIELPAIESVLMKHKFISQAVVVIRKAKKEKILRAYLVTEDINISSKEILSFLSAHLPLYMHPKEFCIVDGIPLKENEKINFDLLEKYPGTLLSNTPPKAPHILTTMEDICCRCFKEAFHREDLEVDDNFFSLDGDSLTALHIISKLKDLVYQDIHLSVLFEYPTIRKLAEYLEEVLVNIDRSPLNKTNNCLIQMSSGTLKPPLFLVHPVGGTTFWYKNLAKEFDGILILYGIEDPSIHDASFKFSTLEEMAKYYVEQILNLYDGKTYYIGGASFGATVSVAMADILLQMGKEVGFLGLFDGWAKYPKTLMQQNTITTNIYKNVPQLSIDSYQTLQSLENYRRDLLLSYKIPIIDTSAILFKAEELWIEFADINTEDNGWNEYINAHLAIYSVPGNHETMFSSAHAKSLSGLILSVI